MNSSRAPPNRGQTPSPVLNRYPAPPVSCWVASWNLLASAWILMHLMLFPSLPNACRSSSTAQGPRRSSNTKGPLLQSESHVFGGERCISGLCACSHLCRTDLRRPPSEPIQFGSTKSGRFSYYRSKGRLELSLRNRDCYFQEMAKSMGLGISNSVSFTALPNLHPSLAQASRTPHPLRQLLFGFEGNSKSLQLLQGPAQQTSFLSSSKPSIWMDCIS